MNNYESTNPFPSVPAELSQLVLSGFDDPPVKHSRTRPKRLVAETLAKLHQLHDELNAQLYSRPLRASGDSFTPGRIRHPALFHERAGP